MDLVKMAKDEYEERLASTARLFERKMKIAEKYNGIEPFEGCTVSIGYLKLRLSINDKSLLHEARELLRKYNDSYEDSLSISSEYGDRWMLSYNSDDATIDFTVGEDEVPSYLREGCKIVENTYKSIACET